MAGVRVIIKAAGDKIRLQKQDRLCKDTDTLMYLYIIKTGSEGGVNNELCYSRDGDLYWLEGVL